ncbi:MAG: hypothetical protein AAGA48_09005 [Myxococcota bacterium]
MKTVSLACFFGLSLVACGEQTFVCVDSIEQGDADGQLDDFVGLEVCYEVVGTRSVCTDDGGNAVAYDNNEQTSDEACLAEGFRFRCGQAAAVGTAEGCPEGFDVVEL